MVLDTLPPTAEQEAQRLKQYDLTEYQQHWYELLILKQAFDDAKKKYERYRDRLVARIGEDTDQLTIGDKVVANYTPGAFNKAKFLKEQPGIAAKYMKPVVVEEFDTDAFLKDHPVLHKQYRTRSLRTVADA
jgi:hypothetical protein